MRRLALPLLLAATVAACKKPQAPVVEDLGQTGPDVIIDGALAGLAPRWPDARLTRAENGMVLFHLFEADTPRVHLRVLLPMPEDGGVAAESVLVVAHALRAELHRRLERLGVETGLDVRPDRIELSVHAQRSTAGAARAALLRVLLARPSGARLEATRRELLKYADREREWAILAGLLLERSPRREEVRPAVLRETPASDLGEAFEPLTDPRRAVVIAHDGAEPTDWVTPWSKAWTRKGRLRTEDAATARLRAASGPGPVRGHLMASPMAPLTDLGPSGGRAVVVLGRRIPVADATSRGLARLAHRVLQEEMDARMSLVGDVALVTVRVSVGGHEPLAALKRAVDGLSELARSEQTASRLHQTSRLWLGARLVQASLDGEDLTSLWRDALDLAGDDAEISGALAHEAKAMLDATPASLGAFTRKWLDPRAGAGGWAWVLTGGDDRLRKALREELELATLPAG